MQCRGSSDGRRSQQANQTTVQGSGRQQEAGAPQSQAGMPGVYQGDHGVAQRQVLVLQALQVAQHLVLRVVHVEDGLLQEVAGALEGAQLLGRLQQGRQSTIYYGTDGCCCSKHGSRADVSLCALEDLQRRRPAGHGCVASGIERISCGTSGSYAGCLSAPTRRGTRRRSQPPCRH